MDGRAGDSTRVGGGVAAGDATSVPCSHDEEATPPGLVGTLAQLAVALVVAALAIWLVAGGSRHAGGGSGSTAALMRGATTEPQAVSAPPAGRQPPHPAPTPPRTDFASIPDAGERLGFRVWYPSVLPEQYVTLYVAWQPDSFVEVPGQRPPGALRAWYWSMDHGAGLLLEQGPGIGVSAAGAPEGEHGAATLPDGRQLTWVRGHPGFPEDPTAHVPVWSGAELRLGVAPSGAEPGWRLVTPVLSLAELLRVAAGLR